MNSITRKTIKDVTPIPFKHEWQPDNKQWLKERKQQWRELQANIPSHAKTSRDMLKAEKHFFLEGKFPEELGLKFSNGKPGYLRIWHILPLLPLQNLKNWLAFFEWIVEYETVCFNEDFNNINSRIAQSIQEIITDKTGLYSQEDAYKLYQMTYSDTYRPEPFRFEQGKFYGCPFGSDLYGKEGARAYFNRWIIEAEAYLSSTTYEEYPAFPILDNFEFLLSCFPYIDDTEFEVKVADPDDNNTIKRNKILALMLLVRYFINPRDPINSDTEEQRYAIRLFDFFENEVPEKLRELWEYAENEQFTVTSLVECEPDIYIMPNTEMEDGWYEYDSFDSLSFYQLFFSFKALPKYTFFNIVYQSILYLNLTDESFNKEQITLSNIKGIDTYNDFIKTMGYKDNQAIPAWRYQIKANEKLLNIGNAVSVVFEALVVFPKDSDHDPIFNLHLRTEKPFLWDDSDFRNYSELMFRQIKFNLSNHPELHCQKPDDNHYYFEIDNDLLAIPKYEFPLYKGMNKPIWE